MTAGWVAANIRAIGLAGRCLGETGAREVAAARTLTQAQHLLAGAVYRRGLSVGATLTASEHAVAETTLWQLRVLAGWQPRAGVRIVRTLAGGFDVANIRGLAAALGGAPRAPEFDTGALDWGWARLRTARSLPELAAALHDSSWNVAPDGTVAEIADSVALAWAARVAAEVPAAVPWAAGAAALLVASRTFQQQRPLPGPADARIRRLLGAAAPRAATLQGFADALPPAARWALSGVDTVADLWQGELRWWRRLDRDARILLRHPRFGPEPTIGAVALLAADMWRVRAALQVAAGYARIEALDEMA